MAKRKQALTVPELLRNAADIYEERQTVYGDTYKRTGPTMRSMFPGPITLETDEDFTRMFILVTIVGKTIRYCNNFDIGGHDDSLADISVYSNMLREIDNEQR